MPVANSRIARFSSPGQRLLYQSRIQPIVQRPSVAQAKVKAAEEKRLAVVNEEATQQIEPTIELPVIETDAELVLRNETGGPAYYVMQSEWESKSPEQKFEIYKELGYVPKDATIVSVDNETFSYNTPAEKTYLEEQMADYEAKRAEYEKAGKTAPFYAEAKQTFEGLKVTGKVPAGATFSGVTQDGGIIYSVTETPAPQPATAPQVNQPPITKAEVNTYEKLGSQFQLLDRDTQQDLITEAFYNQKNTGQKSFDQLTDKQKRTAIDYYVGGLLSKKELAKYYDQNQLTKMAVGVAVPASTNPVGWIVIGGLLVAAGVSVTLSQQKGMKRAINDYISTYGRHPTVEQVSVTFKGGETVPLKSLTQEVKLDTALPPITGIRINTKLPAMTPPAVTTKLPAFTPPTISTRLPTMTPPQITTKLPTSVPAKIDLPTMIVAQTAVLDNPATRRVMTPHELARLWGSDAAGTPQGSYIRGEDIADLDQKIYSAYANGSVSRAEYEDYQIARRNYLTAKTGVESGMESLLQGSPEYQQSSIPKEVIYATLATALYVATRQKAKGKTGGMAMPKVVQATQTRIEEMTNAKLSAKTQALILTIAQTAMQTTTQTITKTGTKTATRTAEQTKTQEGEQTQTQTKLGIQTITGISEISRIDEGEDTTENELDDTTTIPPPGKPIIIPSGGFTEEEIARLRPGAVAWNQGIGWWARWYPYRQKDSDFTRQKPSRAIIARDSRSAFDTIQTISGLPPGRIPKFDMGIMDVMVSNPPTTPHRQNRESIGFVRDPQFRTRKTHFPKFRQNDLGMGIVETRTKHGRRRHLRLT